MKKKVLSGVFGLLMFLGAANSAMATEVEKEKAEAEENCACCDVITHSIDYYDGVAYLVTYCDGEERSWEAIALY